MSAGRGEQQLENLLAGGELASLQCHLPACGLIE
jgi:hypothetical protein